MAMATVPRLEPASPEHRRSHTSISMSYAAVPRPKPLGERLAWLTLPSRAPVAGPSLRHTRTATRRRR